MYSIFQKYFQYLQYKIKFENYPSARAHLNSIFRLKKNKKKIIFVK